MPDEFAFYGQAFELYHPMWRRTDWRRTEVLPRLINQDLFDRAREIVPKDWKRFQADLLRLELLYRFGGVYVDTDVQPLRPFDELLDGTECFVAWSPNRGPRGERVLTQAVMGATAGHPFIKACIDGIPEAVRRYRGRPLAQMVGPWHVTRVYEWVMATEPEPCLRVYPEGHFYPQSNADRDAGAEPDLTGAYAFHRWNSTLRKQGKGLG